MDRTIACAFVIWAHGHNRPSQTLKHLKRLIIATLQKYEPIAEYAVCLQELSEQIATGGINILDEQLIMFLAKDLHDRLQRAANEINVRDTTFKQALAILIPYKIRPMAASRHAIC